ncbi:MAG TPA: glycosyltransferase family 2 protein [Bacteroidales bacterium]|nr:glycosyltransferase family 2 protein [Bacteroidales bacterium]
MNYKVTIVIPCYNEEMYILDCISSLLSSDYKNIEILVVDGDSSDKTQEIVADIQKGNPNVKLLHNKKRITPVSLNIGVTSASGEFIMIAGAHSHFPSNYISTLMPYFDDQSIWLVGGSLKTEVINHNSKSLSIKSVLSNRFGVGNSYFRTGVTEPKFVDAVPFGIYRTTVFNEIGLYNEKLIRNHDIELHKRIVNEGGKIYLIPYVKCTYYARETFKGLAKNNFGNGMWNILTAFYTKKLNSLSLRHFIPLVYFLSLIFPLLLSCFVYEFIYLTILSFFIHFCLICFTAIKINNVQTSFLNLIKSFYVLHFSYGLGSFVGILKIIKIKLFESA